MLARRTDRRKTSASRTDPPPGRPDRFSAVHPSSKEDVVERYLALFAQLETRVKEQRTRPAGSAGDVLPEPEWESLRQALFAANGLLAISEERVRMLLDQSQRGRLDKLNSAIEKVNATHPAAPARAMVMNDAPQPVNPHVFLRGNPGRPGQRSRGGSSRLLAGPDRKPFQKGSGRLELAQAIADARKPADGPGAGQSRLAMAFRQGAGRRRPAISACAAIRPVIPNCSITSPASSSPRAGRSRRCTD